MKQQNKKTKNFKLFKTRSNGICNNLNEKAQEMKKRKWVMVKIDYLDSTWLE